MKQMIGSAIMLIGGLQIVSPLSKAVDTFRFVDRDMFMRYKGGGVGHLWTLPPSRPNRWLPQMSQLSTAQHQSSQRQHSTAQHHSSQRQQEQYEDLAAAGQSYEMADEQDEQDEQDVSEEEGSDLEDNGDDFLDDLEFDADELDEFLDDVL